MLTKYSWGQKFTPPPPSESAKKCEKMDLKIIQSLLERVQIHKNAGNPKILWDLKDFSEEQQVV